MKKTMLVIMVLLVSIAFSKDIYISFVLDETGSMLEQRQNVIDGFNEYLDMLQEKDEKVLMTLTKFNSGKTTVIYSDVNVNYLCGLKNKTYYPKHGTPLYDAIGKTINGIGEVDNMLFVIFTDGLENSSTEYSRDDIFNLIKQKKCMGWTFIFMDADQESYVAEALGISAGNIINFDAVNTSATINTLTTNTSNYITDDAIQTSGFFDDDTNITGEEYLDVDEQ